MDDKLDWVAILRDTLNDEELKAELAAAVAATEEQERRERVLH